ncbi:MAG: hypothetical protein QE269_03945 [Fimbriimonas sp.]|nr:hypothetical protein [Fimbriimonas sp.]
MSEPDCMTLREAVAQLGTVAPGAPLLALGQTVFWDEPMKAGLALEAANAGVEFVAGVHDTDYFAKAPGTKHAKNQFLTLPHNDGSTKALWSAAAEFSCLFGSETVITKDALIKAGLRFDRLNQIRKGFLDEATQAWGWRGIVSLDEQPPITLEVKADALSRELCKTLKWSIDESTSSFGGEGFDRAVKKGDELNAHFCDSADRDGQTLSQVYRDLLPKIYSFVANRPVQMETTQTSQLLRFNRSTCTLPRFDLLRKFIEDSSAREAYDQAIKGFPGLYSLAKFGTGAIPFDLVIPGVGRGTIRVGNRGIVINTPRPQFLSFKNPIQSLEEFAKLIESKFGTECVLVGKAVTLIGMLGREFVFSFHEGASSYVKASRELHRALDFRVNPILRIRYQLWDSLENLQGWFKLPEPLHRAFGSDDVCFPSFAARWRAVGLEQKERLARLGTLRKPIDLVQYLEQLVGGAWSTQAKEYIVLQRQLSVLSREVEDLSEKRTRIYGRLREIRGLWQELERQKGDHFRERIFDRLASETDMETRARYSQRIFLLQSERDSLKGALHKLGRKQREAAQDPAVMRAHERRREIEIEAELKRLKLIREAIVSSTGLENANRRPAAWWLPMISPDGKLFDAVMKSAECWWEPMN